MNRYVLPCLYRGIQIHKVVICNSDKKASQLLDVSNYYIKNYASKGESNKPASNEVLAYMDSGPIIFEIGRKDLLKKIIPLKELKDIIDIYRDKSYAKWKISIGID